MTKRGFETSWHRLMVMHWIGRVALSAPGHSSLEEPGKMMTAGGEVDSGTKEMDGEMQQRI